MTIAFYVTSSRREGEVVLLKCFVIICIFLYVNIINGFLNKYAQAVYRKKNDRIEKKQNCLLDRKKVVGELWKRIYGKIRSMREKKTLRVKEI